MASTQDNERRTLIRVPRRFIDDHEERDLATPDVVRTTQAHYWIDAADPALGELHSDAEFYNDRSHFDDPALFGLVMSAKATQQAIEQVVPDIRERPDPGVDNDEDAAGPSLG